MSMANLGTVAQPISQPDHTGIFAYDNAEARNNYMRSLGAKNINPPLPRSTHLRIKATGRVLPYEDTLAEQQDLVECCDAHGNTDPAAWMPYVQHDYDSESHAGEVAVMQAQAIAEAQQKVLAQARQLSGGFVDRSAPMTPVAPQPMELPYGAQTFDAYGRQPVAPQVHPAQPQPTPSPVVWDDINDQFDWNDVNNLLRMTE